MNHFSSESPGRNVYCKTYAHSNRSRRSSVKYFQKLTESNFHVENNNKRNSTHYIKLQFFGR